MVKQTVSKSKTSRADKESELLTSLCSVLTKQSIVFL